MKKEIICTACPMGCRITVEGNDGGITSIEGYTCGRGEQYGRQEFSHPVRILTTTVKTDDGRLLPVRSEKPLPKESLLSCMEEIKRTTVQAPVDRYQVIIPNIRGSGVDIVATGEIGL